MCLCEQNLFLTIPVMIRNVLVGSSSALKKCNVLDKNFTSFNTLRITSNFRLEKDKQISDSPEIIHKQICSDFAKVVNRKYINVNDDLSILIRCTQFYKEKNLALLKDLHNDPNFRIFCRKLWHRCNINSRDFAINIMKQLALLQVDKIVPHILTKFWNYYIENNIQYFSISDIYVLIKNVLGPMKNTSWAESKNAVLLSQAKKKMKENLETFPHFERNAIRDIVKNYEIEDDKLVELYLNSIKNRNDVNWIEVLNFLTITPDFTLESNRLLKECYKNLRHNLMNCSLHQVRLIIRCIHGELTVGRKEFYDAKLIDTIVDYAIYNDWSLHVGFDLIMKLHWIKHKHELLLNYLIKLYNQNYHPDNSIIFYYLLDYAVNVNCESQAHFLVEEFLQVNKSTLLSYDKVKLSRLVYNMATLDRFDQDLIDAVFNDDNYDICNEHYHEQLTMAMFKLFGPLENLVNVDLWKEKLKKKIADNNKPESKKWTYPLKSYLELLFGGDQYCLTKVKTTFNLFVDHFVIFRQGGYPLALNNKWNLEKCHTCQFLIPKNCHSVVILYIPLRCHLQNTGEITGFYINLIKCQRAINTNVVVISELEWNKISEIKKLVWLMDKIKKQCQHIFNPPV